MNKRIFYDTIRQEIFDGKIKTSQFKGIEAILHQWEQSQLIDMRWLAYMLATTYHETGATMQPIEEKKINRKNKKYNIPDPLTGKTYYGRGFVQLTWKYNYETMSKVLSVDLVHKPELALEMSIAAKILFEGMINGFFTRRCLADYFNDLRTDWINARKIVNGMDKAALIASYAMKFYKALTE